MGGGFDETVVVLSHFKDLKDPRQRGKVTYPPNIIAKPMAQNLIRRAPGKASPRRKREAAGWDGTFLASLIVQEGFSPDSPEPAHEMP